MSNLITKTCLPLHARQTHHKHGRTYVYHRLGFTLADGFMSFQGRFTVFTASSAVTSSLSRCASDLHVQHTNHGVHASMSDVSSLFAHTLDRKGMQPAGTAAERNHCHSHKCAPIGHLLCCRRANLDTCSMYKTSLLLFQSAATSDMPNRVS